LFLQLTLIVAADLLSPPILLLYFSAEPEGEG
jgi:hypothetical protein